MKLPLNGGGTYLGKRLLLQPFPCDKNQCLLLLRGLLSLRFGCPRTFLAPFSVACLVSFQPLKEPLLRTVQPGINLFRRRSLHILHNGALPDFLFHGVTSFWLNKKIIVWKRISGNRCDGSCHLIYKHQL
jgi:hypothetical protein